MPLPGGVSKFCGRVYNIGRKGADFNACLGLELRALEDVEAAVRVACFRFGPQGLRVEPSQPLPVVDDENEADDDDEEEDDDDDEDVEYDDDDNDVDSSDYETFSVFGDDFIGSFFAGGDSDSEDTKPVKKVTTTTKAPLRKATRKPTKVATTSTTKRRKATTPRPTKVTTKVEKIPETTAKPLMENLSTPAVATNQSEVIVSNEKDPSPPHESIAAVTAMLQELPAGAISQMPVTVDGKPLQAGPIPAPVRISTENQPAVSAENSPKNVTMQGATVTPADKLETTTTMDAMTTEEEEDESPSQSFIVKSEEEEDDPVADAVEDVLGDDDSKENKNKKNKIKGEKQESGEIVDDILEGVAETITFDDGESDNKKNGTAASEVSNEDEDDDDDDEDDDDSEDEDDEESRKTGEHFERKKKGRKSRVMWLDRLHW